MKESDSCALEIAVTRNLEAGALSDELRIHAERCTSCTEVIALNPHLRALRGSDRISIPPLGRLLARAEIAALTANHRRFTWLTWSCAIVFSVVLCSLLVATGHPFPLAMTPASAALILGVFTTISWCAAEPISS